MIEVDIKVTGLKETLAALKDLPRKVALKILRPALRAGAKVIHTKTVAAAPVGGRKWLDKRGRDKTGGLLKSSLKVRARKRSRNSVGYRSVTDRATFAARTGDAEKSNDVFYAPFVEFGHKIGARPKSGGRSGLRSKSGRFMRDPLVTTPTVDSRTHVEGLHFMEQAGKASATQAASAVIATAQAKMSSLMAPAIGGGDGLGE